ncbi:MAG: VOC family protein [Acidobacteriota bacterium]
MSHRILGLHHVTATVDDAQPDLDFACGALGLRLLKKTVNFDNHHVYHFYYGDERGTPGTIWTTFPYHGRGVQPGVKGAGQIVVTSFSVPAGSLAFWTSRLRESGTTVGEVERRFGEESIEAVDPSGLVISLVAGTRDARPGWTGGGVAPAQAVRGLHSVTLLVRSPRATADFLADLLGFEITDESDDRIRVGVNGGGPGRTFEIVRGAEAAPAKNGLGTVHHVALAIAEAGEQARLRQDLLDRDHRVTEVLDRQYFQSIYFREPGGVLLEVATVQPGFTVDEPLDALGRALKLPPWEEPNRSAIEAGLPPIVPPGSRVSPNP